MLTLIEGPAGGGKSQEAAAMRAAGEVAAVADVTALWAALSGARRGPDGLYPVRDEADPALALALILQTFAVRAGLRRDMDMAATTSRRGQAPRWQAIATEEGAEFTVRTVDPGEDVIRSRLAGPDGSLSQECERAVRRWYP